MRRIGDCINCVWASSITTRIRFMCLLDSSWISHCPATLRSLDERSDVLIYVRVESVLGQISDGRSTDERYYKAMVNPNQESLGWRAHINVGRVQASFYGDTPCVLLMSVISSTNWNYSIYWIKSSPISRPFTSHRVSPGPTHICSVSWKSRVWSCAKPLWHTVLESYKSVCFLCDRGWHKNRIIANFNTGFNLRNRLLPSSCYEARVDCRLVAGIHHRKLKGDKLIPSSTRISWRSKVISIQ
jgi:hypothetical protein